MGSFRSEGEFWECYKRFNVLYGGHWCEWRPTQARSKIEDLFGARISPGEMYFRKPALHDHAPPFILSMASMEKVLRIVMLENRGLTELAEKILRARRDEDTGDQGAAGCPPPLPAVPLRQGQGLKR